MSTQDPGRTLADALTDGPLPPEELARIGAAVARDLAAMHRAGRPHRAVRPESVVMGPPIALKAPSDCRVPAEEEPAWLAPEGAVDARSDVYALGILLYRMLSGAVPVSVDPIPPIRIAVPATLEHITRRALQPRPEDRYAEAGPIALALEAWLATRPATGAPAPLTSGPSIPRAVGGGISISVGILLVAIGAIGVGIGWWSGRTLAPVEVIPPPHPPPEVGLEIDGVRFDPDHAERALAWVNDVPKETLEAAGIYGRGVEAILSRRPFSSIEDLGAAPGVGRKTLEAVASATR